MNDGPFPDSRALTAADLEPGPDAVPPSSCYKFVGMSPQMVSFDCVNFYEVPDGMTLTEFVDSFEQP